MTQPTRSDLLKAVKLIKQWHDMALKNPAFLFRVYYDQSPEMKFIRDILGPYDKMKDEVIECTSIDVKQSNPQ